ncbi:MAG TPA: UbiA family prenyltransferase [Candidatus Dormibacteraeota bacterium]|nr:UbiA family prenyltransferase [Candidatus Dormibacteraeota bacterium]
MSMPKSTPGRGWRGYLLLLHPGPSLVCTTVTTVAGWSAWRQADPLDRPAGHWPVKLALGGAAMAFAQVSTGVLNDAFDAPWDRLYQQYKPIASGSVPRSHAWVIGVGCGGASLLCARAAGLRSLRLMQWGLGSGWSYSLGLSRTPLSFLPFASGLATVPLVGPAAMGVSLPSRGQVAALAAGLGLGLHLANGGPDIELDRLAGRRSLPVLLGVEGSRLASHLLLGSGALAVALGSPAPGRRWAWGGAGACSALVLADRMGSHPDRAGGGHPFVLPALAGGALALGWLLGRARAVAAA